MTAVLNTARTSAMNSASLHPAETRTCYAFLKASIAKNNEPTAIPLVPGRNVRVLAHDVMPFNNEKERSEKNISTPTPEKLSGCLSHCCSFTT